MDIHDKLRQIVRTIPDNLCGVYYLHNQNDDIIYNGKSVNIKKRLLQHFRSKVTKEVKLQMFTYRETYESAGNELIALLRESELIKEFLPIFNRVQRKVKFSYSIYKEKNLQGYDSLLVRKLSNTGKEVIVFSTLQEAKNYLFTFTEKYNLCQKINGLYSSKSSCFQYSLKECKGACISLEDVKTYNLRVEQYLRTINLPKKDILIELKGRTS